MHSSAISNFTKTVSLLVFSIFLLSCSSINKTLYSPDKSVIVNFKTDEETGAAFYIVSNESKEVIAIGEAALVNYTRMRIDYPETETETHVRIEEKMVGAKDTPVKNIVFEGITSKGRNDIIENIIVYLQNSDVDRHRGYIVFPNNPVKGSLIQGNILFSMKKGQFAIGEGNEDTRQKPERFLETKADKNIYFNTKEENWCAEDLAVAQQYDIEKHSLIANPIFTDIENGDFSFKPGSPTLKLGIAQPVSTNSVGLEPAYEKMLEEK